MQSIDTNVLSEMIQSKRGSRGLREAAKEIGISLSTLSRVENGNLPDIDSYVKICRWLEVSADFFTSDAAQTSTPKQVIVANLRADKTLPKDTAEALIKMINLAYGNVKD